MVFTIDLFCDFNFQKMKVKKNSENWQCGTSEKLNFNTVFVSLPLYGKFIFGNLILDWSTSNNIEHQCTVVTTYILDIKGHPTHHIRIVKNKRKHTEIQQTKMLVTCQRFGDLFLFWQFRQYSSNHKTYNKGRFKVIATYLPHEKTFLDFKKWVKSTGRPKRLWTIFEKGVWQPNESSHAYKISMLFKHNYSKNHKKIFY